MSAAAAVVDLSPRALADEMDDLVQQALEADRQVASILSACRESLRALAWHRYAAQQEAVSRARTMRRRHKGGLAQKARN